MISYRSKPIANLKELIGRTIEIVLDIVKMYGTDINIPEISAAINEILMENYAGEYEVRDAAYI